jgi:hypothetical protein
MKLYTEEQVRQAMDFARGHHRMSDTQFIGTLTTIELPSDDDVEKKIEDSVCSLEFDTGFESGVKWMRYKIQEKTTTNQ